MLRLRYAIALLAGMILLSCNFRMGKERREPMPLRSLFSERPDMIAIPLPERPALTCLLKVRQAGCGGPCPEWEALFYDSGVATLVNEKGAFSAVFSTETLDLLLIQAKEAGFFTLPDTIPSPPAFLPELPHWQIAMRRDSLVHELWHSHQGPGSLRELEAQLETWISALEWERID